MSNKKGYQIPETDILYSISILDYPERVIISKKRRPTYYRRTKTLPKKYKGYPVDREGYIINPQTKERVIKNSRVAGKPRYYNISGEDLWSFNVHPMVKAKVATELKIFYYEIFRGIIQPLNTRIGLSLEFHGNPNLKEEDLDNLERWHKKCILDALCGNVEFIENINEIS